LQRENLQAMYPEYYGGETVTVVE